MTLDESRALKPGLYVISWKDGGESLSVVSSCRSTGGWPLGMDVEGFACDEAWWRKVAMATPVEVWNRRAAAFAPKKAPRPWPRRRLLALAVVGRLNAALKDGDGGLMVRRLRDDLVRVAKLDEVDHIDPTIVQAYGGPE
jgi:hypothetical protein